MKSNLIGHAAMRCVQALLLTGCLAGMSSFPAMACITNPLPITETLPDGTELTLHFKGDKYFHWYEDEAGFTVIRRDDGYYVYAAPDGAGNLIETSARAGLDLPDPAIKPGLLPSLDKRRELSSHVLPTPAWARAITPKRVAPIGTVKNLVILARFSDHVGRPLPLRENYDNLFNSEGGDPTDAPTGSVRDVYSTMSYGQMTLKSTVVAWVTLPNTEAYYADGVFGLDVRTHDLIRDALALADPMVNFSDFDTDKDGYVDSIAFVHSGYGAEFGGTDMYGTPATSRIWSHRWAIYTEEYVSGEGVRVFDYHINPGVWGLTGSSISRIGVVCHETGHFFGLPDLYDTDSGDPGEGIGSWCMMANSWGFNNDQYNPPHFSPWSKIQLGWVTPTVISSNGVQTIGQVQTNPVIHKITSGFPEGEYLLIENRNKTSYDQNMPVNGGLGVWHIDENAEFDTQGFPGQAGWPENGNHYHVALLQADGRYDLEKGNNKGDSGDLFRTGGVAQVGPFTTPSTNTYQSGIVASSRVSLSSISIGGQTMTYTVDLETDKAPEISVLDGDTALLSGSGSVVFGTAEPGGPTVTKVLTVTNSGNLPLSIFGLTVSAPFQILEGLPTSLAAGASDTFTLALPTTSEGTFNGTLTITSNDSDEGVFSLGVLGAVSTINTLFEPFSNFTSLTTANTTSSSSVSGNLYTRLTTPSAGGYSAQPGGIDGNTFVQSSGLETARVRHQNPFTVFNAQRRTHQSVYFIRFTGGSAGTTSQVGGPSLGDANFPAYVWRAGYDTSNNPILSLVRFSNAAGNLSTITITTTNAPDIAPNAWIPVVVQFEAPSTATGTDGGMHVWVNPQSPDDAPLFSRGTGVNGGSGATALGGLTYGAPANGSYVPGRLSFGPWFANPVANSPTIAYDRVALWDGPLDLASPDTVLLQRAIDWINEFSSVEVGVTLSTGANIPDGTTGIPFGSTSHGGPALNKTFSVYNEGGLALTTAGLSVPAGYLLVEGLSATIPVGSFDNFTVQLPSSTAGTFTGTIQFTCNDPDESPFNFTVTGTVTPPTATPTPTPTRTPASDGDSDKDGFSDDLEVLYGSNPNNADSKPNFGDADDDGTLTMKDALALAVRVDRDGTFTDPKLDMNGDRTVTGADARIIYFWSVNAAGHQVLPVN